jgi:hypothetical protein
MPDDTGIRQAAQHYMERGWAVIALYGVDENGQCRCGDRDPEHRLNGAGKHPIGAGGRGDGWMPPLKDPADLPVGANIGLKTGHASAVFALDVDPKHGGDARLAELIAEYGELPPTWTQQTGSGGYHYVFALPDDFTPTNSRGRLPVGLDIRGEGGQIVLAPSVSGIGPYEALVDCATLAASAWLLDLIRPLPPIEIPAGLESAFMPERTTDRGQAYAQAAVAAELAGLEAATPGSRNHTAFNVACRLIELSNSPWAGLGEVDAAQMFRQAGWTLVDSTFTERELWACWTSATRKVQGKAAVLPAPPGGLPVGMGWDGLGGPPGMPPFSLNGSGGTTAGPVLVPVPNQRDPFADALPSMGPIYTPGGQTPPLGSAGFAAPALTGHLRDFLLPRSQLSRLPRPVPLIQGVLWRDTDAWLIGESGSGKSFIGLDWAAHIASGREWNNRRTVAGPVIWVVAEGSSGVQQRVDAWEAVYGPVGDALIVLPVAVQAAIRSGRTLSISPQWRQLMEIGAEIRPALILLDTQARMTRGINENDNDEIGQWLDAVSDLRRASQGACNLVVHHTGRGGSHARGASAIDGAQDVEWRVERTGAKADMRGRIVADKVKDGADGTVYPFALKAHRLGWDEQNQEYVTSLTVSYDPFDQPAGGERPSVAAMTSENMSDLLDFMASMPAFGMTRPELIRIFNKTRGERGRTALSEETIKKILSRPERGNGGLLERDLVDRIGEKWVHKANYEQWLSDQDV